MEKLEVTVLPEDFRSAPEGYQNSNDAYEGCVLWQALHRMFPDKKIRVLAHIVNIDGVRYRIPNTWGSYISDEKHLQPQEITGLSISAKESLVGIPTINLTLIPYET